MNMCQKSPTLSLNFFWRVIKGLPPFSSAPNRWQMWRSLVTWGLSCPAGKPALTFYKISRTAFSSNLDPLIGKKQGGTKRCLIQHEKTSTTLRHWTEINKRISLGFHFDFGRGWASVFILSSRSALFSWMLHWHIGWDWKMKWCAWTSKPIDQPQNRSRATFILFIVFYSWKYLSFSVKWKVCLFFSVSQILPGWFAMV